MKKVIVTGATGFIGKKIIRSLLERGDEVTVLTRSVRKSKEIFNDHIQHVEWNIPSGSWRSALEGKDAVIHLAGENVMAKRWNTEHKNDILESRVNGTRDLVIAIEELNNKPEVFLSASAVGYYGNTENAVDEKSNPGEDFLSKVVAAWEKESMKLDSLGVRRVNIRMGLVLDRDEGALARMIIPFKFFLGGSFGDGMLWYPWIHIDDVVGIFLFALDQKNVNGILNAVSPQYIRMKDFCKTLGDILKRPSAFNVPKFILRILFGEGADVLLNGAKVIPKRTIEIGYQFKFAELKSALVDLLTSKNS